MIPTGASSTLRQSNSQADIKTPGTGIEHDNKPISDPVGENTPDEISNWQFTLLLFGKSGIAVAIVAFIAGILMSLVHPEHLVEVLRDLITPAAVLLSVLFVIFIWVTDLRFLSQSGESTKKHRELLCIVNMSSLSAILGISSVVLLKLSLSEELISLLVDTRLVDNQALSVIRTVLGGLASSSMGLVLVGLTRLIFSTLDFVIHQREQAQSVDTT